MKRLLKYHARLKTLKSTGSFSCYFLWMKVNMGNEQHEIAITQRQLWTAIPIAITLLLFFAGIMAAYWSLKLDINTIQQKQSTFEDNIKNINDNTKKIDTRTQGISEDVV